ncbi:MAG: queuosine precursor transporter [Coxiellaceae bacterium]|nr:queuosine precursor transporter [Coxiellaceae bacterium]
MNTSVVKIKSQFKYYMLLSVFYAVLMITAQAVAYRMMLLGPFIEPGGIFIFPATFALSDIIAEVYGPTLARRTIFTALIAQSFFSLIPLWVNAMPHPINWHHMDAYHLVFGASWLVFLSNLTAVLVGMILNAQIIGKTKILTQGRYFSLRSLFSSAIGEFVLTAIIVAIALVPVEGWHTGMQLFINMFLFKVVFSAIAVLPASLIVVLLKKVERVDIYEEHVSFNPLSALLRRNSSKPANVVNMFPPEQSKAV